MAASAGAPAPVAACVQTSPSTCDGPVIHFDNVTKTYANQSRPALENVSLDVEKGEFVFLREERPTEGRIYVAGKDLARITNWKVPYLRRRIGCVFQDFRLLPGKNVYHNVAFALQVIGKPRRFIRKVVPEVIDLVGLEGKHDRMPDELSGGEQQRVAVARAFVNRPMILLADEPTGNIDPATSIGIMKVLDRINRTGTTVVMATHDAAIVDSMRKRVIELEYGKVVRDQSRGVYGQAY
jgi:cell division transport system ATP-binding protein